MPSFNVNLIFVAKIIRDVNYVVVFYADSYLIQAWSLKKTIRVGRLDDGLFVVKPFPNTHKCSQVTFSSNPTLWHQHLGHPSFLHCDILGKYYATSSSRAHDFLTIMDNYTRGTWKLAYFTFHAYVETQFCRKIKIIRSNNEFEFDMKEFYQNKGIMHETTCTNNPQQNGVVESKHGLNIARALHFQANLLIHF